MAGWGGWAALGEQCVRYVPCERLAETEATLRALSGNRWHLPPVNADPQVPRADCPTPFIWDLSTEEFGIRSGSWDNPPWTLSTSSCPEWGAVKATGSRGSRVAKYWCTCFWAERAKLFSRTENTSARAPVFSLCLRGSSWATSLVIYITWARKFAFSRVDPGLGRLRRDICLEQQWRRQSTLAHTHVVFPSQVCWIQVTHPGIHLTYAVKSQILLLTNSRLESLRVNSHWVNQATDSHKVDQRREERNQVRQQKTKMGSRETKNEPWRF